MSGSSGDEELDQLISQKNSNFSAKKYVSRIEWKKNTKFLYKPYKTIFRKSIPYESYPVLSFIIIIFFCFIMVKSQIYLSDYFI